MIFKSVIWFVVGIASAGYYYLWKDVDPVALVLSYTAVRDGIVVNLFFALGFTALIMFVWPGCRNGERPHAHQSIWLLFLSMLVGVLNLNRLSALVVGSYLLGRGWDDVPATGFLVAIQTTLLLAAFLVQIAEHLYYHRNVKGTVPE